MAKVISNVEANADLVPSFLAYILMHSKKTMSTLKTINSRSFKANSILDEQRICENRRQKTAETREDLEDHQR